MMNTRCQLLQDPDRTRFLLKFAQEATPELIELFEEHAPPHVRTKPHLYSWP